MTRLFSSSCELTCVAGVFGTPDLLGAVIKPFRPVLSSSRHHIRSLDDDGLQLLVVSGQVRVDVDRTLLLAHAHRVNLGSFTWQGELLLVQVAPRLELVDVVLEAVRAIRSVVLVTRVGLIALFFLVATRRRVLVVAVRAVVVVVRPR